MILVEGSYFGEVDVIFKRERAENAFAEDRFFFLQKNQINASPTSTPHIIHFFHLDPKFGKYKKMIS